jgi:hypothetical protein
MKDTCPAHPLPERLERFKRRLGDRHHRHITSVQVHNDALKLSAQKEQRLRAVEPLENVVPLLPGRRLTRRKARLGITEMIWV